MTEHEKAMVRIYVSSMALHTGFRGEHLRVLRDHKLGIHKLEPRQWRLEVNCVLIRHRAYLGARRRFESYMKGEESWKA